MIKLTPLVAGTMNWGAWDKKLDTPSMSLLIRTCTENGMWSFDHADIYGGYTTEADFGMAFKHSGLARDSVQFISKCGIKHVSGRDYRVKHYDYSADYIVWSVENSLRNLQTDYLDVLLLHRPSPLLETDQVAHAVTELKRQGKIRSFGVSNFTPFQTEMLRQKMSIDFNQLEFSATHLEPLTDGSLDYVQIHAITPMAWSPLGTVFKAGDEKSKRIIPVITRLANHFDTTADVILIAWILRHPAQIVPVFGTADLNRIKNLPRALEIKLDTIDWFEIWEASRGEKVP